MILDSIYAIVFFALIGLVTNGFAFRKGFYEWHPAEALPISLKHVIGVFAIYLGATFILTRYFSRLLQQFTGTAAPGNGLIITIQFLIIVAMVVGLIVYCRTEGKGIFGKIWKNPAQSRTSPMYDLGLGVLAWLLAFPLVVVVAQFFDLLLYLIFHLEKYEQVAVQYLKSTLQSPMLTALALISIVGIAPCVEEFLFRGTLQTYFKKKFGAKTAIIIAAICFALFHYSPQQGLGNLSLIPSLFAFGCFLGFIYERQGSLFAPIGLHMAFNFASSLRIIFSPESL